MDDGGAGAEDRADNREAHRVLGTIYSALADERDPAARQPQRRSPQRRIRTKAIEHLESAIERPAGQAERQPARDARAASTSHGRYDKAIPLLSDS